MLPDGTYDEEVLSNCLGVFARHEPGLAATLMNYFREEQKRLLAAINK